MYNSWLSFKQIWGGGGGKVVKILITCYNRFIKQQCFSWFLWQPFITQSLINITRGHPISTLREQIFFETPLHALAELGRCRLYIILRARDFWRSMIDTGCSQFMISFNFISRGKAWESNSQLVGEQVTMKDYIGLSFMLQALDKLSQ